MIAQTFPLTTSTHLRLDLSSPSLSSFLYKQNENGPFTSQTNHKTDKIGLGGRNKRLAGGTFYKL